MQEMAMTQNFVRVTAKDVNWNYLQHKKADPDKWKMAKELEQFTYTIFDGYHGQTMWFRTSGIADLYRVYDSEWNLILETEDEVVELPSWYQFKDGKIYSYKKEWDEYIIVWESNRQVKCQSRKKKKNYKLSVVVPLYNSELFMCRTIDAILSSSLDSIELILIDDGSKDKSFEIAQWYAEKYWCVRAYHQENQGVSFARNRWLELAEWEYIAFCDNDDIPHPLMYLLLYYVCETEWTDIAICPALIRKDINDAELYLTCKASEKNLVVYSFEEMAKNRWTTGNIFRVAVWNKIVKTETARLAKFPTDYTWPWILYEDVAYTGSLYSHIDKFAFCKTALYTWDKRKQKTVWTASTRHSKYDNEYVWKMFIFGFSYMLYNKSWKHLERHDFTHFKRLIESYDKFSTPSPLRTYRDEKLKELVNSQKLYDNQLIMANDHLREVVERVR